jgi:hypothetical protein
MCTYNLKIIHVEERRIELLLVRGFVSVSRGIVKQSDGYQWPFVTFQLLGRDRVIDVTCDEHRKLLLYKLENIRLRSLKQ